MTKTISWRGILEMRRSRTRPPGEIAGYMRETTVDAEAFQGVG
jgi:hypothetical protein